jgi:NAD(P)-dependent dehydrogenase (short-subunit alcohol dehydrogenase family)
MTSLSPDLTGRVALITGASRGIGRCIALKLASCGCDIVVAAKTVEPQPKLPGTIHTVAAEVVKMGRRALPVQCDVRSDADVQRMVDQALATFGRIDILICNSGALWWMNVESTPMSKYDLVHGVNVRAVFSCVRAVLPAMQQNKYGRIIVMSPPVDLGWLRQGGKVAYLISKVRFLSCSTLERFLSPFEALLGYARVFRCNGRGRIPTVYIVSRLVCSCPAQRTAKLLFCAKKLSLSPH